MANQVLILNTYECLLLSNMPKRVRMIPENEQNSE